MFRRRQLALPLQHHRALLVRQLRAYRARVVKAVRCLEIADYPARLLPAHRVVIHGDNRQEPLAPGRIGRIEHAGKVNAAVRGRSLPRDDAIPHRDERFDNRLRADNGGNVDRTDGGERVGRHGGGHVGGLTSGSDQFHAGVNRSLKSDDPSPS